MSTEWRKKHRGIVLMWNSDLELRGQFARLAADRAESATSSPSFSFSCRQCTLLDVFDGAAAVSHAHQESVTTPRRLVAWLSARLSLSLPAVKPSATNKAISSNAALSNSNECCGGNKEILAQNMSCLRLSLMRGWRHSGRPTAATAPSCLPSFLPSVLCMCAKQ